jgi:hypothetical protein
MSRLSPCSSCAPARDAVVLSRTACQALARFTRPRIRWPLRRGNVSTDRYGANTSDNTHLVGEPMTGPNTRIGLARSQNLCRAYCLPNSSLTVVLLLLREAGGHTTQELTMGRTCCSMPLKVDGGWRGAVADARTCDKPSAPTFEGSRCSDVCADSAHCLPKGRGPMTCATSMLRRRSLPTLTQGASGSARSCHYY